MWHSVKWNVLAMAICVIMIMPPAGFAGDGTQWGSTATQIYNREVPALSEKDEPSTTQDPGTESSTTGQDLPPISGNDSPLSVSDKKSGETSQTLTEEESVAVLVRVDELIDMALNDMKAQSGNSSEKSVGMQDALSDEIHKYEEAKVALDAFFEANSKSLNVESTNEKTIVTTVTQDTSVEDKRTTAFKTLENVSNILGQGLSDTPRAGSPALTPSENLIQRFARYAADSVQKVRERMTEDASLPEAKIFSAEESPEVLPAERPVLSREVDRVVSQNYQVLGSVVLNRETAKTFELLNPPQKLHPFIRWLFYGRHLTKIRAERYLAARAKVREICLRAKAGEGLIRYKGKVMEMFLPLPGDEGAFELVRQM